MFFRRKSPLPKLGVISDYPSTSPAVDGSAVVPEPGMAPLVQIALQTTGKPSLGMVLTSLLLQEQVRLQIHLVDTSSQPVIRRDDVAFALRLGFERGISCGYEYCRDRVRPFSEGRLRGLRGLGGPFVGFLDDDVVLPSRSLRQMVALLMASETTGYVSPVCRNAPNAPGSSQRQVRYAPGAIFRQDSTVRKILFDYYGETRDVLDGGGNGLPVSEGLFLSLLFPLLGRPGVVQEENVVYHLDYMQRTTWHHDERELLATSHRKAHEFVARHQPAAPVGQRHPLPLADAIL